MSGGGEESGDFIGGSCSLSLFRGAPCACTTPTITDAPYGTAPVTLRRNYGRHRQSGIVRKHEQYGTVCKNEVEQATLPAPLNLPTR